MFAVLNSRPFTTVRWQQNEGGRPSGDINGESSHYILQCCSEYLDILPVINAPIQTLYL